MGRTEEFDAQALIDEVWREHCAPPSAATVAALERRRAEIAAELQRLDAAIAAERAFVDRRPKAA